ncbi:FHA domain containing protein [Pseudofrankia inefficax]|uniref:FHA domain containing protein n=1 Tax=Pseudofrankia inefficax (strain DSM 45817 / CECT 9037 / DDB 130130 / EuI1c) TaxID=298654 RepID=E3IYY1_PSEI1|nr:FHA domain containing protein [Pseudofrankia inefficax]
MVANPARHESATEAAGLTRITSILLTAVVSGVEGPPRWRDVVVRFRADATVGDLRAALAGEQPGAAPAAAGWLRRRVDPEAGLLVDGRYRDPAEPLTAVLRHGVLVAPRAALAAPDAAPGGFDAGPGQREVAVVGGLWAGAAAPLGAGEVVVGRGSVAGLRVDDPNLSRAHARFDTAGGRVRVRDNGSTNGTRVGGQGIDVAELTDGDVVELGGSVLAVRPAPRRDADLAVDGPFLRFNRPPRTLDQPRWRTIAMPTPPSPHPSQSLVAPAAALVVPLATFAILYFMHALHGAFVYIILLAPLAGLVTFFGQRHSGRRDTKRANVQYQAALARAEADLAFSLDAEAKLRRHRSPDAATVLAAATGPTHRLWERRPDDDDALRLRLGTADLPAGTSVRHPPAVPGVTEQPDPPTVPNVPVHVSLPEVRVLGLAGDDEARRHVARGLVCQLAGLHAPSELRLTVLAPGRAADWAWASWLPHAREHLDVPDGRVTVACDQASIAAELNRLVATAAATARRNGDSPLPSLAASGGGFGDAAGETPPVVLIVDGARALRDNSRLRVLLRDGPSNGVFVIALERQRTALPEECQATCELADDGHATLRRTGRPEIELLADGVTAPHAARLARALAPLLVSTSDTRASIPSRIGFLSAHGRTALTADDVVRGWADDPERLPVATLGVSGKGAYSIDLRNGHDGPHLLVGGRTGMGKSEVLGTMITSLALRLPPSALAFLLIDLKEGSGLAPFAALPHTLGLVTNVGNASTNVERVLTSLDAMRTSRQQELTAGGGNPNYDDYVANRRGRPVEIPRLVVVVDEFAELRDKYPDALERLISMARLGRSAGIHLVLGTQLISRHVTGDIAGNANLKICLTVDDPAESQAVVNSRDPAIWPDRVPGRAAARSDLGYAIFQAGWLGAPAPVAAGPAALCTVEPFEPAGLVAPTGSGGLAGAASPAADAAETERDVVFAALALAADAAGERPDRGLNPPLPATLLLGEVTHLVPTAPGPQLAAGDVGPRLAAGDVGPRLAAGGPVGPPRLALGLEDIPGRLAQPPYWFRPRDEGHLLVQGGSRSGRTTLLRSVALAASAAYRAGDLHLHVADFAGAGLRDLGALPNVGTLVELEDTDRVTRLLRLLVDELRARQELLAAHGVGDLTEARERAATDLPYVLLLVDRYDLFWERYWEQDNGALVTQFDTLLRDGPAAGMWCVVTTGGTGLAARSNLGIRDRLLLPMASRDDAVNAGLRIDLPVPTAAGRGYRLPEQQEVQVAIVAEPDQAAAVAGFAAALVARDADLPGATRPATIEPLPAAISAAQLENLRTGPPPAGQAVVTLGAGGTVLGPVDLDLDSAGGFLVISGPPMSGRSTALLTVLRSLTARGGWSPIVLAPRPGPVRDLAVAADGTEPEFPVLTRPEDVAAKLTDLIDAAASRVVLLIDDADRFFDGPAGGVLNTLVKDAYDRGIAVVAASRPDAWARAFRNWGEEVRQARTGVLLWPRNSTDGELFQLGPALARGVPGSTGLVGEGRGLLVVRGRFSAIQIATP